jgi:hypothetical protein
MLDLVEFFGCLFVGYGKITQVGEDTAPSGFAAAEVDVYIVFGDWGFGENSGLQFFNKFLSTSH